MIEPPSRVMVATAVSSTSNVPLVRRSSPQPLRPMPFGPGARRASRGRARHAESPAGAVRGRACARRCRTARHRPRAPPREPAAVAGDPALAGQADVGEVHLAQRPRGHGVAHEARRGVEAHVLVDAEQDTPTLGLGDHPSCVGARGRDGLLAEDVAAGANGVEGDGCVEGVRRSDRHEVESTEREQLLVTGERVLDPESRCERSGTGAVRVADGDDLDACTPERGHVSLADDAARADDACSEPRSPAHDPRPYRLAARPGSSMGAPQPRRDRAAVATSRAASARISRSANTSSLSPRKAEPRTDDERDDEHHAHRRGRAAVEVADPLVVVDPGEDAQGVDAGAEREHRREREGDGGPDEARAGVPSDPEGRERGDRGGGRRAPARPRPAGADCAVRASVPPLATLEGGC